MILPLSFLSISAHPFKKEKLLLIPLRENYYVSKSGAFDDTVHTHTNACRAKNLFHSNHLSRAMYTQSSPFLISNHSIKFHMNIRNFLKMVSFVVNNNFFCRRNMSNFLHRFISSYCQTEKQQHFLTQSYFTLRKNLLKIVESIHHKSKTKALGQRFIEHFIFCKTFLTHPELFLFFSLSIELISIIEIEPDAIYKLQVNCIKNSH